MEELKLFDGELKFMNIIWEHSPINSTELAKLAKDILGWKKSTTYTVLRKLCEKGIAQNNNATVSYLVPKEQVQLNESREFIHKIYDGSLKLFLANFLGKEKLSIEEAIELKNIIDENIEEED